MLMARGLLGPDKQRGQLMLMMRGICGHTWGTGSHRGRLMLMARSLRGPTFTQRRAVADDARPSWAQVDADDARPRGPEFTQRPTVADDARPLWARCAQRPADADNARPPWALVYTEAG